VNEAEASCRLDGDTVPVWPVTVIPPPERSDTGYCLATLYGAIDSAGKPTEAQGLMLSLIRRCHAAEAELAAIRDMLTPLLGAEPCGCENGSVDSGGFTPWDEPINIACPICNGTGTRNIADGLSMVEYVRLVLLYVAFRGKIPL